MVMKKMQQVAKAHFQFMSWKTLYYIRTSWNEQRQHVAGKYFRFIKWLYQNNWTAKTKKKKNVYLLTHTQ